MNNADMGQTANKALQYPGFNVEGLKLEALVLHPNGWVIEGVGSVQQFWLEIQRVGWMRFERIDRPVSLSEKGTWLATEVRPGPCPDPHQSTSLSGVLWTRRAALEAHQAIFAFQAGADQTAESFE